jgi:hypothetical protein
LDNANLPKQVAELHDLLALDEPFQEDPAWLAIYFMVLAWSISAQVPDALAGVFSQEQACELAQGWVEAAEANLFSSRWWKRPTFWALQAQTLMLSWTPNLVRQPLDRWNGC